MPLEFDELFAEPGGWQDARTSILVSLAFFGIYAFFEFLGNVGLVEALVIGAAVGVDGLAEILPGGRWRAASVLRLLSLGMLVAVVVINVLQLLS